MADYIDPTESTAAALGRNARAPGAAIARYLRSGMAGLSDLGPAMSAGRYGAGFAPIAPGPAEQPAPPMPMQAQPPAPPQAPPMAMGAPAPQPRPAPSPVAPRPSAPRAPSPVGLAAPPAPAPAAAAGAPPPQGAPAAPGAGLSPENLAQAQQQKALDDYYAGVIGTGADQRKAERMHALASSLRGSGRGVPPSLGTEATRGMLDALITYKGLKGEQDRAGAMKDLRTNYLRQSGGGGGEGPVSY